jgi:lysophospholipase L1-like esterase
VKIRIRKIFLWIFLGFCLLELSLRGAGALYLRINHADFFPSDPGHPSTITVLALGESTTGGLWVKPSESYPGQLERMLKRKLKTEDIRVLAPLSLGQNSSQILNRVDSYYSQLKPDLVILMCGINNEWSLSENNVTQFLDYSDAVAWHLHIQKALDNFRIYKITRWALSSTVSLSDIFTQEPQKTPHPAPYSLIRYAREHHVPFLRTWRHDIGKMIDLAQARGIKVLLMTYPNYSDGYLPNKEFENMALLKNVPLVRNDLTFHKLISDGLGSKYLLHDNRHPSPEGYRLVAENALKAILEKKLISSE